MDDPNLFRKLLLMAEAEAAKRRLADAPSRVERIIVQEGEELEKALRGTDPAGGSKIIVRVIARVTPAELAPFPDTAPLRADPDNKL